MAQFDSRPTRLGSVRVCELVYGVFFHRSTRSLRISKPSTFIFSKVHEIGIKKGLLSYLNIAEMAANLTGLAWTGSGPNNKSKESTNSNFKLWWWKHIKRASKRASEWGEAIIKTTPLLSRSLVDISNSLAASSFSMGLVFSWDWIHLDSWAPSNVLYHHHHHHHARCRLNYHASFLR